MVLLTILKGEVMNYSIMDLTEKAKELQENISIQQMILELVILQKYTLSELQNQSDKSIKYRYLIHIQLPDMINECPPNDFKGIIKDIGIEIAVLEQFRETDFA